MNMNICFQFDFDAVVDPNLHQKRSEKGKGKQGQRRQRKPSVASLAKEPASRQASDSHLGGRVTQAHRPAFSTGSHLRLKYFYRKQASPTMSRHQNPAERSLKHALLVELLLKLRRGEVQLQVLPTAN